MVKSSAGICVVPHSNLGPGSVLERIREKSKIGEKNAAEQNFTHPTQWLIAAGGGCVYKVSFMLAKIQRYLGGIFSKYAFTLINTFRPQNLTFLLGPMDVAAARKVHLKNNVCPTDLF